ncbi:unnamed protein product [Cyprideis torosa]|uniref:Uncharacterized protein n=1 Tax=Cyprideis torosa TaxID=163714 RepID=A0A7R8WDD1_9CRUS|nr:unnamed protein product [Cyprideis torosa]CAG0888439.1 unnamed protein product [Cyprideis torosa]
MRFNLSNDGRYASTCRMKDDALQPPLDETALLPDISESTASVSHARSQFRQRRGNDLAQVKVMQLHPSVGIQCHVNSKTRVNKESQGKPAMAAGRAITEQRFGFGIWQPWLAPRSTGKADVTPGSAPRANVPVKKAVPVMWQNRIINGEDASQSEFAYQVSLRRGFGIGSHTCGGSIIADQWILTAAHCLERNIGITGILYGDNGINDGEFIEQEQLIQHPSWNSNNIVYDYGLVKLSQQIPLDDENIAKRMKVSPRAAADGTSCTVTGWGATRPPSTTPSVMQQATQPVVGDPECRNRWPFGLAYQDDLYVCLEWTEQRTCFGDSGGPLVCDIDGDVQQIGVVSFGDSNCSSVSVFAEVNFVRDWINGECGGCLDS